MLVDDPGLMDGTAGQTTLEELGISDGIGP